MKKNTLLKIAKTIYLQNIVSKQLFAATFNPQQFFVNQNLGDFRAAQKLQSVYSAFIGQKQRPTANGVSIQFLKKLGLNIQIYKFSWGNSDNCSEQLMTVLPLNQAARFLISIQSFVDSKASNVGLYQTFDRLKNSYKNYFDKYKNNKADAKTNFSKWADNFLFLTESFLRMFSKLFMVISKKDNNLIDIIDSIKQNVQILTNKIQQQNEFKIEMLFQYDEYNQIGYSLKQIQTVLKDDFMKKIVDSITTNASRINMLDQMYNAARDCSQSSNISQDQQLGSYVKQAIQTCNSIKQLNRFDLTKRTFLDDNLKQKTVSNYNLQNKFNIVDRSYINDGKDPYSSQNRVRYIKNSLTSFVSGYSKRIKTNVFDQAIEEYTTNKYGFDGLTQQQYDKIKQLQSLKNEIIEQFEKGNKQIKSTNEMLYYQDFIDLDPKLMDDLKKIFELF